MKYKVRLWNVSKKYTAGLYCFYLVLLFYKSVKHQKRYRHAGMKC